MSFEGASVAEPRSAQEINRSLAYTVLAIFALGGINGFLLFHVDGPAETRHLYASAILWVSAYPGWRHLYHREKQIPFVPVMTIFYALAYALPAFQTSWRIRDLAIDSSFVDDAVELALAGELLLLGAFYAVKLERLQTRIRLQLDLARVAPLLLVAGWALEIFRVSLMGKTVPAGIAQWLVFLDGLPVVALGALLLLYLRGRLSRMLKVGAVGLLALTTLADFTTGFMSVPASTLVLFLFVFVAERRRVPVVALAVGAAVLMVAMGVKQQYRETAVRQGEFEITGRASLFARLMEGAVRGGDGKLREASSKTGIRIDHLTAFAHVIARTPASVPYWGGKTYETLLTSLIPRVLYPDKPQKTLGQDYGHRYRFITPSDTATSINLEQLVEMYANYGLEGVIIGMFLMGFLYRCFYRVLNHPDGGDGGMLIAANAFRVMLNIESDFSMVFGGILQGALLLYLLLWAVARPLK
jgi:hypothetical protein